MPFADEDGPQQPVFTHFPFFSCLNFERRNLRFTVGSPLSLFELLDITAEYSFGIQDNLTIGLGLTI